MVIDTSELVAIALKEPSRAALLEVILEASGLMIASVSLLEAGIVLQARVGDEAVARLYQMVEVWGAEVVAFDKALAKLAIVAFGRFGKGMKHRAVNRFWPQATTFVLPISLSCASDITEGRI